MGSQYQHVNNINSIINSNNKSNSYSYNNNNNNNHSNNSNISSANNAQVTSVSAASTSSRNALAAVGNSSDYDNDEELVTINGITGIIVNKEECANWRGPIPLSEYPINVDPNPIVIRKKYEPPLVSNQNVYIRYLRPPTPPPSGDLVIEQEDSQYVEPPPLIIREVAPKKKPPKCDDVIVIREAPPREYLTKSTTDLSYMRRQGGMATASSIADIKNQQQLQHQSGRKALKLFGYNFTLGPRKLIIERRPPSPERPPQSIIVERWLAPSQQKQNQRRAMFRAASGDAAPRYPTQPVQATAKNAAIRNQRFDQDIIYDEIRL